MKAKLGTVSLVVIIGGLIIINNDPQITSTNSADVADPCTELLTYRIADIDSQYDLSEQKLKAVMQEVETLWESALDRDLLNYNSQGSVDIHIIYSNEQQHSEKEQKLSQRIEQLNQQISTLENEYQRLSKSYESKQEDLENISLRYKKAVGEYNNTVKKWNKRGGIPKDKKPIIEEKQQRLDQLRADVQRVKENTELVRRQVNARSERLNSLVDHQNTIINMYNRRFAEARKFDQGRYVKKGNRERINIYQFSNLAELKTVLAHEAGHAMGLEHVEDPASVMHALMSEQNIFDLSLTDADISALSNRCGNQL